jgi:hypothetical protein
MYLKRQFDMGLRPRFETSATANVAFVLLGLDNIAYRSFSGHGNLAALIIFKSLPAVKAGYGQASWGNSIFSNRTNARPLVAIFVGH